MSASYLRKAFSLPALLDESGVASDELSLELLNDLILLCPDAIIGTNKEGLVIIFNQAAERLTGMSSEEVIDKKNVACFYETIDKARAIKQRIYSNEDGGAGRLEGYECEIIDAGARPIPIRLSAALLYRNQQEVGCVGFFHDISLRKQLENELRNQSIQDCLSRLFNHRHFHLQLKDELARARRYHQPLSLICIDLDHFKRFNDSLGHLEGDKVIRLVGDTLRATIRDTDMAFRYGGDEFMVLLPHTPAAEAFVSAERIRQHFLANWPFQETCRRYGIPPITMSIGVTQAQSEDTPANLIQKADKAMYQAKRSGRDRVSQLMEL